MGHFPQVCDIHHSKTVPVDLKKGEAEHSGRTAISWPIMEDALFSFFLLFCSFFNI
jgi:hypothetical protein